MLTTTPTTLLPEVASSTPSTEYSTLPLATLLGLSVEKMNQEELRAYTQALRNARQNAPTLQKHIAAALPKVEKEKKPKKAETPVNLDALLDL